MPRVTLLEALLDAGAANLQSGLALFNPFGS